jgi:hypothetical protein
MPTLERVVSELNIKQRDNEAYEAFALRAALKANGLSQEKWQQLTEPVQTWCNEVLIADDKRKEAAKTDAAAAAAIEFPTLEGFVLKGVAGGADKPKPAAKAAKVAKSAPKPDDDTKGRPRHRPEGLHSYTERWNALAAEGQKLGLKVREHTSDFSTYEHAQARVRWLEAQVDAAKNKAATGA